MWALRHYAPTSYAGHVEIYMSRGSLQNASLSRRRARSQGMAGSQLDWLHLIEAQTLVHDIPGNHDSITGDNRVIIEPAHMQVLACKLRRSIDQVLGERGRARLRIEKKTAIERNDE